MSGEEYGMKGGDCCYVSMFSEASLRNKVPGYRIATVTLDGAFTLGDLKKLAAEFERRLAALPPDLAASLRDEIDEDGEGKEQAP